MNFRSLGVVGSEVVLVFVVMLVLPLVLSVRLRVDPWERSVEVDSGVCGWNWYSGSGIGSGMGSAGITARVEVEEDLERDSSVWLVSVASSAPVS